MSIERSKLALRLTGVALGSSALLLAGCQSGPQATAPADEPPATPQSDVARGQGDAWEAVFFTPGLSDMVVEDPEPTEFARRDESLSIRSAEPLLATKQWPEPLPPSIRRTRIVSVPQSHHSLLFFTPAHPWYDRPSSWGGRDRWYTPYRGEHWNHRR